jgi:hypothetical protein
MDLTAFRKRKKERERLENRYPVKIDFYRSFYQEKNGTVPDRSIRLFFLL